MSDTERPTLLDVGRETRTLPRDFVPMRARLAASAFNSPDHLFEVKWDGIRALAGRDRTGVRVVDRMGADLLTGLPELRGLPLPDGTLLDGEIIVCDTRGRPNYDLLAARVGAKALRRGRGPIFVAFDLLYEHGEPLLADPLEERRKRLLARGLGGPALAVPEHLENDGEPFLEVVAEYGLEGIVAKRRDGHYVPGARSADWLKCHVTPRSDAVLGGLVVDERRGARLALCGAYEGDGDGLVYVGDAYVPPYLGQWLDEATRAFVADVSAFHTPLPLRDGLRWLQPRLVAIVEHGGASEGELRDARFRALRLDGVPDDCRRERPEPVPSYPPRERGDRPRLVVLHSLPFPME